VTRAAILLVDDEKTVLDSLKTQLRKAFDRRFTYELAENVPEAWEIIEELVGDGLDLVVVVSDWLMPGVRGDEFLAELRERHPNIVRIMLTGQADPEAIERAHRVARVECVLNKPWSIDELTGVIEGALNR